MTARELIEALAKLPPDTRVLVDGYEDGLDDFAIGEIVSVYKSEQPWYYGAWNQDGEAEWRKPPEDEILARDQAVVLSRQRETSAATTAEDS